jgi:hypothetical protein
VSACGLVVVDAGALTGGALRFLGELDACPQASRAAFAGADEVGERATVDGPVARLGADLVAEDLTGLAHWLRRHVGYAELETARREATTTAPLGAARRARRERSAPTRPLARTLAKEVVLPLVPARPVAVCRYMAVARAGFLDGRAGARPAPAHSPTRAESHSG